MSFDNINSSEVHQTNGLQPIVIQKCPDRHLEIFIGEKKESDLSKFLPEGVKFVAGADFNINKLRGELTVPIDRSKNPIAYRILLSHEIGHGLDPDYEVLDAICNSKAESFEERVKQENARLKMEVNAWNYGKSVSDLMNIDNVNYENICHLALKAYQMAALEKIILSIDDSNLQSDTSSVEIYNPITQDTETLSILELRKGIEKLYETNEIFKAGDELKRAVR